jgi:hypothetical protein
LSVEHLQESILERDEEKKLCTNFFASSSLQSGHFMNKRARSMNERARSVPRLSGGISFENSLHNHEVRSQWLSPVRRRRKRPQHSPNKIGIERTSQDKMASRISLAENIPFQEFIVQKITPQQHPTKTSNRINTFSSFAPSPGHFINVLRKLKHWIVF